MSVCVLQLVPLDPTVTGLWKEISRENGKPVHNQTVCLFIKIHLLNSNVASYFLFIVESSC